MLSGQVPSGKSKGELISCLFLEVICILRFVVVGIKDGRTDGWMDDRADGQVGG